MTMFLRLGRARIRDYVDRSYLHDPEVTLRERRAMNARRTYLWAFITDMLYSPSPFELR